MLSEHLPHPGWQPLWYCGTRTDYIYPPALRYGTVLISRVGHVIPARAYHLYTAFFYVFGIVAVYWLVRIGSSTRGSAPGWRRPRRPCSRHRFCCCHSFAADSALLGSAAPACADGLWGGPAYFRCCRAARRAWPPRSLRCAAGSPPLWQPQALFALWWSPTTFMVRLRWRSSIRSWSGPSGLANARVESGCARLPIPLAGLRALGVLAHAFLREDHRNGSALGLSAGRTPFRDGFCWCVGSFLLSVQPAHSRAQGRREWPVFRFRRRG